MNQKSAKRYFDNNGKIYVVDFFHGVDTLTVRVKRYTSFECAIQYVQHSKCAHFANYSTAKKYGFIEI